MAYFNSQSNNRNREDFSPKVYSKYSFVNSESAIDKSRLSFSMWKSNLQITITPIKEGSTRDNIQYDNDNAGSIYINHTKARIFAEELKKFLADPDTYHGSSVFSGKGIITISNGSDVGGTAPVLIIRIIDDAGKVVSSYAYEFKTNFHKSIHNYTGGENFTSEFYPNIEIEELITMLEEYYKAVTSAVAFSVIDAYNRNHNYLSEKLNAIASKLGIETASNGNGSNKFNNSASNFFNGNNNSSSSKDDASFPPATLDDIYDE